MEGSPRGKELKSQFHCNNGARALSIVAIVCLHSVYQLTRELHHILSQSYWLSNRASGYYNGCFFDNLLERAPTDPWKLALFKQERANWGLRVHQSHQVISCCFAALANQILLYQFKHSPPFFPERHNFVSLIVPGN